MIWSLSRVLTALRMELGLPTHEEGVATVARALLNPNDEVAYKVTSEGLRDSNGADPFLPRRPVVLIDNENSITLTNRQSGAFVVPAGLAITGDVILPADPDDSTYYTIGTRAVGSIQIIPSGGNNILGYDGELSDTPQTTLTTGTVTLVYSSITGYWHVLQQVGTYTISSGV